MSETSIQPHLASGGALNSEHYQTFEIAKANDDVLGGDDIAQIRSYAAFARAQAQAIHKAIAATSGIDDVAAIKAEATETAQTFAKVGIYADQRIGEILRELPRATAGRKSNSSDVTDELTKDKAIQNAGIERSQAYDLQAMAANPEVVEAVIAKATEEGRVVTRKQVLDAIADKKRVERELEDAKAEISALGRQNDQLYEKASAPQQPERVITREVAPQDYTEAKQRVSELERLERLHSSDNEKLRRQLSETRRELEQARGILGMSQSTQDVRRDVQYLITATNSYVRQYGGLTWTVQQLEQVDAPTLDEFRKAATNLATFASALVASLEN